MRTLLRQLFSKYLLFKHRRQIRVGGGRVVLGRQARITTFHGAQQCIDLHDHAEIYGSLSCCGEGTIQIGAHTQLGPGSVIRSARSVVVGQYTGISTGVVISDNNSHPVNPADRRLMRVSPHGSKYRSWIYSDTAPIVIGDACWIGENARICKGVTVGNGAVVAANAVVTKDVPPNSIAAGNPARIVKTDIDKLPRYFKD